MKTMLKNILNSDEKGNVIISPMGITLIALVITIIVILILVAVTLSLGLNNGILKRAKEAREDYTNAQIKEKSDLEDIYSQILVSSGGTVNLNLETLEQIILDKTYPVGSIYFTTKDENPGDTLGGTWEKYSEGRTIIGDGEDSDGDTNGEKITFVAGNKGGEYKHVLSEGEMPSHTHGLTSLTGYDDLNFINGSGVFLIQNSDTTLGWGGAKNAGYKYGNTGSKGSSQSHNNIQPYVVTYIWKRIA